MADSHDDTRSPDHYGATIFALTSVSNTLQDKATGTDTNHQMDNVESSDIESKPEIGRNRGFWSDDDILCSNVESSQDESTNYGQYLYQTPVEESTLSKQDQIDNSTLADLSSFEFHEHEFHDKSKDALMSGNNYGYTNEEKNADKTDETLEDSEHKSHDNTNYSDGYFDQSIDKIYERYNKSKLATSESSSAQTPTGCFDPPRDIDNANDDIPFYRKCIQKKYIVLASTALSMLLALTVAIILVVNVFHVTDTHHYHGNHYHGNVDKNAQTSAEFYQKASVTSNAANCSRIGVEILKRQGTAVDAAVATCFCIGVTNRYSSGIGGGGHMIIYIRANQTFDAFDFRETAPGRIKSNAFEKDLNASRTGGMAIAVPGDVKGLYTAWKKYGHLPWKDLVQPAIDLAENGVPAGPDLITVLNRMSSEVQSDPGLSKLYLDKNGDFIEVGTIVTDKELAKTLSIIRDNPNDFYSGDLGARIVNDVKEAGGDISFDDLQNYKVMRRDIVKGTIENFEINTIGAPSGGPVVMAMLNILKGYNFKREDMVSKAKTPLTHHRIIEAMKFAFAEKAREGDPDFNEEFERAVIANMTSEELGSKYRRLINDSAILDDQKYYGGQFYQIANDFGTSHVSVIAENGDAVSVSTTINRWFGSSNRSSITGIIYNNQINDFSIRTANGSIDDSPPSPMNSVHSGKRPVTSMSPMILTDNNGDVKLVIGGVGGKRIIPAVAQVIMNKVWFEDDLGAAVNRPRVYNFLQPPVTYIEKAEAKELVPYLSQCNQTVEVVEAEDYAAVMAIYVESKSHIYAKADRRKISAHSSGY